MPYFVTSGAPTYEVITQPTELSVTLEELKTWLKIPAANTSFADNLNEIIPAVTKNAEIYTKRDMIAKTYLTYRDGFVELTDDYYGDGYYRSLPFLNNQNPLELRRTPTQDITSIKYINEDDVLTTVDSSVYYFTRTSGSDYSKVLPVPQQFWPTDILRDRLQVVEIEFVAGWPDSATLKERWPDLWQAMLTHMAFAFTNRGDCVMSTGCECGAAPNQARVVYDQYLILDFVV